MVEIYKTDVNDARKANMLVQKLSDRFPYYKVNFDLHDDDKILRIDPGMQKINHAEVIDVVQHYHISILPFLD